MTTNNIGLIGLCVMGRNLVLNLADNGYSVSVYNRSESKTIEFIQGEAAGKTGITAFYNIAEFINSIEQPRKVLLMVKAGESVDKVIDNIFNYLSPGDVIADLGNSNYQDTLRRQAHLEKVGINFAGIGVSGGEDGARRGPSIMPGGDSAARKLLEPIFMKISAEVKEVDGSIYKCCNWVGSGGAGHFVKMVHNGIEYGDM